MTSVEEWDENLMVNTVGVGNYYGPQKRKDFEQGIVPIVNSLHACLLKVRYPGDYKTPKDKECRFPDDDRTQAASVDVLTEQADLLNENLYCFVNSIDRKGEGCTVSISHDSGWDDPTDEKPASDLQAEPTAQPKK